MGLVGLIIMAIFDIVEHTMISNKLLEKEKLNNALFIVYMLVIAIIKGVSGMYIPLKYNFFIGGLLVCSVIYLIYEVKFIEIIYIYIISTVIVISTQLFSILILKVFMVNVKYKFIFAIISQFISFTLIIFIIRYIPIHLVYRFVLNNNRIFKALVLNIFVLLISILVYWYIDISGFLKNIITIGVLSAGIIYVNLVFVKEGLRNQHKEEQLKIYENYLPIIDELMNELRAKQHEFDNHIQALRMLTVTSKDFKCIVKSMNDYIDDLEEDNILRDLVKLDNKVLAGLLYSKIKRAEELGIDFEIIIKDYGFKVPLKDYELVEVIGNLINNAFETGVEDNSVTLELKKEEDMNVIEARNKHPYLNIKTINKFFMEGVSTKSSTGRGFGLYNVKEITNKYNGKIEVYNKTFSKDNYLVFRVLLR